MVYQPKSATGYQTLITWRQAGEIYHRAKNFTRDYLNRISDSRLVAHINDSARSVQRNIEEGYKRATTKEYVQFLGFSRGSLEELKGDFEELKREWREGIRWGDKGERRVTGIRDEVTRGEVAREAVTRGEVARGEVARGEVARGSVISGGATRGSVTRDSVARDSVIRGVAIKEIDGILDLIYGEDCMIGRQIMALEDKMISEKTLPRSDMVRRSWNKSGFGDKRFWAIAEDKFGLRRDERGIVRRVDKGDADKEDVDKGKEG